CMLYQDVISAAGPDYASTLKSSYQKPISVPKKNVLLSLLSGASSLVFGGNVYAEKIENQTPPPPPPKQTQTPTKSSPPPAVTPSAVTQSQISQAATTAGNWLTQAAQSFGVQKADGNVPKNAWFNFQITNQGWQKISTTANALGFNRISAIAGGIAATGASTTVKSDGNWNVQMTGAGSSITGLKQQGFGNIAGAFWNSNITNSTQAGALNGLFASNGSSITGAHQYGFGNVASAANFSKINGLQQSGAFSYARAYNRSSLTNIRQYGVGNFMAANNFSHYSNINQIGAFNAISNNATYMNRINQYGFGNTIMRNAGSSFSNINQFGAFNQLNNNKLSSFNNISQIGAFNQMNKNIASTFSNINQYGIGNSMSMNKLSSFSNINQIGALNKIDNNVFSTFNRITQTGIGNSISGNIASTFKDINQIGALNKINNNLLSSFSGIKQYGLGNSISNNKLSSFSNINQIGALNKIDNNVFSTFNRITQTGIGNSISGNKSLTLVNTKQYGAFNKINATNKLTIENINQTNFSLDSNIGKESTPSALGGGSNNTPPPMAKSITEQKSSSRSVKGDEGSATEKEAPATASSDGKKTVPEGRGAQPATAPLAASTTPAPAVKPNGSGPVPGPNPNNGEKPEPKSSGKGSSKAPTAEHGTTKPGTNNGNDSGPAPAIQPSADKPAIRPPELTPGGIPQTISIEQTGVTVAHPAQGPPDDAQKTKTSNATESSVSAQVMPGERTAQKDIRVLNEAGKPEEAQKVEAVLNAYTHGAIDVETFKAEVKAIERANPELAPVLGQGTAERLVREYRAAGKEAAVQQVEGLWNAYSHGAIDLATYKEQISAVEQANKPSSSQPAQAGSFQTSKGILPSSGTPLTPDSVRPKSSKPTDNKPDTNIGKKSANLTAGSSTSNPPSLKPADISGDKKSAGSIPVGPAATPQSSEKPAALQPAEKTSPLDQPVQVRLYDGRVTELNPVDPEAIGAFRNDSAIGMTVSAQDKQRIMDIAANVGGDKFKEASKGLDAEGQWQASLSLAEGKYNDRISQAQTMANSFMDAGDAPGLKWRSPTPAAGNLGVLVVQPNAGIKVQGDNVVAVDSSMAMISGDKGKAQLEAAVTRVKAEQLTNDAQTIAYAAVYQATKGGKEHLDSPVGKEFTASGKFNGEQNTFGYKVGIPVKDGSVGIGIESYRNRTPAEFQYNAANSQPSNQYIPVAQWAEKSPYGKDEVKTDEQGRTLLGYSRSAIGTQAIFTIAQDGQLNLNHMVEASKATWNDFAGFRVDNAGNMAMVYQGHENSDRTIAMRPQQFTSYSESQHRFLTPGEKGYWTRTVGMKEEYNKGKLESVGFSNPLTDGKVYAGFNASGDKNHQAVLPLREDFSIGTSNGKDGSLLPSYIHKQFWLDSATGKLMERTVVQHPGLKDGAAGPFMFNDWKATNNFNPNWVSDKTMFSFEGGKLLTGKASVEIAQAQNRLNEIKAILPDQDRWIATCSACENGTLSTGKEITKGEAQALIAEEAKLTSYLNNRATSGEGVITGGISAEALSQTFGNAGHFTTNTSRPLVGGIDLSGDNRYIVAQGVEIKGENLRTWNSLSEEQRQSIVSAVQAKGAATGSVINADLGDGRSLEVISAPAQERTSGEIRPGGVSMGGMTPKFEGKLTPEESKAIRDLIQSRPSPDATHWGLDGVKGSEGPKGVEGSQGSTQSRGFFNIPPEQPQVETFVKANLYSERPLAPDMYTNAVEYRDAIQSALFEAGDADTKVSIDTATTLMKAYQDKTGVFAPEIASEISTRKPTAISAASSAVSQTVLLKYENGKAIYISRQEAQKAFAGTIAAQTAIRDAYGVDPTSESFAYDAVALNSNLRPEMAQAIQDAQMANGNAEAGKFIQQFMTQGFSNMSQSQWGQVRDEIKTSKTFSETNAAFGRQSAGADGRGVNPELAIAVIAADRTDISPFAPSKTYQAVISEAYLKDGNLSSTPIDPRFSNYSLPGIVPMQHVDGLQASFGLVNMPDGKTIYAPNNSGLHEVWGVLGGNDLVFSKIATSALDRGLIAPSGTTPFGEFRSEGGKTHVFDINYADRQNNRITANYGLKSAAENSPFKYNTAIDLGNLRTSTGENYKFVAGGLNKGFETPNLILSLQGSGKLNGQNYLVPTAHIGTAFMETGATGVNKIIFKSEGT
ncbi:MAG: hypothetical protein WC330_05115, partial [Candidatus Omnitrophota bacterium]